MVLRKKRGYPETLENGNYLLIKILEYLTGLFPFQFPKKGISKPCSFV